MATLHSPAVSGNTYREARDTIHDSLMTSYWLQAAVTQLEGRDPVDALYDAETLVTLMAHRCDELLSRH